MRTVFLILFVLLPMLVSAQERTADAVFVNGDVYRGAVFVTQGVQSGGAPQTGARLAVSVLGPRAQAIAVRDGRILAIGSNNGIRKLKGPKTQEIDLGGRFVMPG